MKDEPKPFLDHLDEIRSRLFVVLVWLVFASIVAYFFTDPIIRRMAAQTGGFIYTGLTEAFFAKVKIAIIIAVFISVPVIVYQLWKFVAVGLKPDERQGIFWILPFSYALFCIGVACTWFVVLPAAIKFLLSYSSDILKPMISIDTYISFVGYLSLGIGLMFQLPLVILFLVRAELLAVETLVQYRRHTIVALAIIAAAITPGPDPVSQLVVFAVSYVLFELSIWLCRLTMPKSPQA